MAVIRAGRGSIPTLATADRHADSYGYAARVALLVSCGYYAGAKLGLALTFSPHPISVLWPPNAILFAALLLLPTRAWWIAIVAALPAHVLAELHDGIPGRMVLCWYVSNVSEAMIGAGAARVLLGREHPFASPRNVMMFLLAALNATLFSSFLDSAFVKLNAWGQAAYWELWITRVFSNSAANVVIVPAIVAFAGIDIAAVRRASARRFVEAAALVTGLAIVTMLVFNTNHPLGAAPAEVCLPLPFLLWAAFRFGAKGASALFAFVILAAIWGAGHGVGALGLDTAAENAHSVQLFALCLGPTLLCLGAAVEERMRNEEAIGVNDTRFQLVLEATDDTVYERDIASGALWWGRKGLARYGHSADGVATFAALVQHMHPDDRGRVLAAQQMALAEGRTRWESEYRLRRTDGLHAHVHEQGFIVRDSTGNARKMIAAIADVTERRDTEDLAHRLAQASRLTAMGEMAASIAHEINQPMSAILSNVDAAEMLLDAGAGEGDELRAILADIRSDDMRASEIIRHIRSLANKQEIESTAFDPNELVRTALRLAQASARGRHIAMHAICGAVPAVHGDKIHVQQVVLNLIFNAMDAMREAATDDRVLVVQTATTGPSVVKISVRDRGHGIRPEEFDRIFDSFYTTKADGLGLGLSIARSLIFAHGGRIWAENNPDRGATFTFTLPVDRREPSHSG